MKNGNPDAHLVRRLRDAVASQDASLDLGYERLGDAGVLLLTRVHDLSHVRMLNLGWNEITDLGAKALAECASLSGVTHLHLDSNQIGDTGARALAASPHLSRLRLLNWGRM